MLFPLESRILSYGKKLGKCVGQELLLFSAVYEHLTRSTLGKGQQAEMMLEIRYGILYYILIHNASLQVLTLTINFELCI